jgi:hypothetical protein
MCDPKIPHGWFLTSTVVSLVSIRATISSVVCPVVRGAIISSAVIAIAAVRTSGNGDHYSTGSNRFEKTPSVFCH